MNYELEKASNSDIEKLIQYKKQTIFEYAKNLSEDETQKINNYVLNNIQKEINNYLNIKVNNKTIGCILLTNAEDGKLLDEIFIEEEYRNQGIGTSIIKTIIQENDIIYLWVDKQNIQAISLYKRLGFNVIKESDGRFFMKYERKIC